MARNSYWLFFIILSIAVLKFQQHRTGERFVAALSFHPQNERRMTETNSNNNDRNTITSSSSASNTKKYRMVAFDLDGTLLRPNHQISDDAVKYLRYLHEKGFLIVIATGRSPAAIAEVIQRLNFDFSSTSTSSSSPQQLSFFPVVSTNGAKGLRIYHELFTNANEEEDNAESKTEEDEDAAGTVPALDWENNPIVDGRMQVTEIFHEPVPLELTRKVLQLGKSMKCPTNYYLGHEIYAQIYDDEWNLAATQFYAKLTGTHFTYIDDDYHDVMQRGLPSKLLINCLPEHLEQTYAHIQSMLCDEEVTIIRGCPPNFVEILHHNVCKGNGLQLLCQHLKVPLEECIAFGDGDNDIEFVEMAGLGIAMKNGRATLKAVADGITEHTNNDDGAIRMLQQLEAEGRLRFPETPVQETNERD